MSVAFLQTEGGAKPRVETAKAAHSVVAHSGMAGLKLPVLLSR